MAVTSPGTAMGSMMRVMVWVRLQPSIRAASSISMGIDLK